MDQYIVDFPELEEIVGPFSTPDVAFEYARAYVRGESVEFNVRTLKAPVDTYTLSTP